MSETRFVCMYVALRFSLRREYCRDSESRQFYFGSFRNAYVVVSKYACQNVTAARFQC